MIRLLISVLFMLLISGCGKTGPLYLPGSDNEKDARPAPVMKEEVMNHG